MDNLKLYNQARTVPDEAKKSIPAGRLKGMTDINPMWRIKRLTEMFGPCGIGWWYTIESKHIERDEITNQTAAFVDILLFYKDPSSGEDSHGIPGTGGASFVAQERNSAYLSDECFKMALTDAISVAAKAIGVGADVYFEKDRSKYNSVPENVTADQIAYNAAIAMCKDILLSVTNPETANANVSRLKEIPHAMTSQNDTNIMWNRHIKSLGLEYDRVSKAYVEKQGF